MGKGRSIENTHGLNVLYFTFVVMFTLAFNLEDCIFAVLAYYVPARAPKGEKIRNLCVVTGCEALTIWKTCASYITMVRSTVLQDW